MKQPPSGGCVLKHGKHLFLLNTKKQPPSGGCVLKQINATWNSGKLSSRLRAAVC